MSSTRLSFLVSMARSVGVPSAEEAWAKPVGGGWATGVVLCFIFLWQLLTRLLRRKPFSGATPTLVSTASPPPASSQQQLGAPAIITDADLGDLVNVLVEKNGTEEIWEDVIEKKNDVVSYNAKCCRQKDGPIKYLSTTTFEKCSTELLRDFYMDTEYRKKWDKTVVEHEQLEVDEINALEIGRTVKKFPFLTPREYILVWRLWEHWQGKESSYYCLTKDYEHPMVPRQRKYVRVGYFRSGWRIRKVPGRDACEIKMVHQEDAGLNVEMARLAFSKSIWNYICKTNVALRQYPSSTVANLNPNPTLRIVPVPEEFVSEANETGNIVPEMVNGAMSNADQAATSSRIPAKKWIGKGILLVGGLICLSRGPSRIATQLAVACFLNKLAKKRDVASQQHQESPQEVLGGRQVPRHCSKFQRRSFITEQLSPSRSQTRW